MLYGYSPIQELSIFWFLGVFISCAGLVERISYDDMKRGVQRDEGKKDVMSESSSNNRNQIYDGEKSVLDLVASFHDVSRLMEYVQYMR